MALSHGLAEAGNPPSPLETDVHSIFEQTDAGFRFTSMAITVGGEVPGIDQAALAEAATAASEDCPVSQPRIRQCRHHPQRHPAPTERAT